MPDMVQMDNANKAICFALRNPPKGKKRTPLKDIRKIVRKTNGKKPSLQAISKAAATFKETEQMISDSCAVRF